MKAVIKSSDSNGNTNINRIDYQQDNNNISMEIDNNGIRKQYEMTVEDVLNMIGHNKKQQTSSLKQRLKAITLKTAKKRGTAKKRKTRKATPYPLSKK